MTARKLTRRFAVPDDTESVTALDGVSLDLAPGAVVAVVGGSGSGKSSLLNMIGAMDLPTSGTVTIDGIDLTTLDARGRALARRRIGMVFQQFHLLPGLGALENVVAPLAPYVRPREARRRAQERLAEVGLDARSRALPSELSGGQQQRVAIARALVVEPSLLLADEPTGNLDPATGSAVIDLLLRLRAERGSTLLLVTHDAAVAAQCDRIIRLENGRVVGG